MINTSAALGVAAVAVPSLDKALEVAGACYLGWLTWQALRHTGTSVFALSGAASPVSRRTLFTMGVTTNLLNPKIAVMYLALIPQFVSPEAGAVWAQSLLLGSVQIVVALAINAMIVCLAGGFAVFLGRRPSWIRVQRLVMGTVLGALAVRLLTDRSQPTIA